MPSDRSTLIPRLEKLKAGLGAAGVVAVGIEALSAGAHASFFRGVLGDVMQASVAVVAGLAAGYVTDAPGGKRKPRAEASEADETSDAPGR